LAMLEHRLDALAKVSKIALTHCNSCSVGTMKMIRSSAYRESRYQMVGALSDDRMPHESTKQNSALRASIAMTKRNGERELPCRSPLT
jgi:hypothetical protein